MAEFSLVSVVLVGLFLAILQLGLVMHVRTTLVACAAEGARYAANAGRTPADGQRRTAELVAEALSPRFARGVTARQVSADGVPMVQVEVSTVLPLVGMLGVDRALTVRGHAVDEDGLV